MPLAVDAISVHLVEGTARFDSAVSVTLEVSGTSAPGSEPVPTAGPPPAGSGPLPFTGIEIEPLLLLATVLIVAGLAILTLLRTRMEPSHA